MNLKGSQDTLSYMDKDIPRSIKIQNNIWAVYMLRSPQQIIRLYFLYIYFYPQKANQQVCVDLKGHISCSFSSLQKIKYDYLHC